MRLFVALDIDSGIRERISQFISEIRSFAPSARWVSAESLHITLKFIGEQSPPRIEEIKRVLAIVRGTPPNLKFRGTGFFPNPGRPRVFCVGVEADAGLPALANRVDEALAALGLPGEERGFSPHLTLARGGDSRHPSGGSGNPRPLPGDKPNRSFARLQERLGQLPATEFGVMTAENFFLYESNLSSSGAHYTKLARFPLTLDYLLVARD
ncbi:MAG: RNA 2',3'-cyclic phosphodiesterase [Terriglobales bacterium]|jgi:RNA 2',3'-cyclic 3'-phosphodiesterase